GKLGPLDVYPQEDKQREDELSAEFVRSGFKNQIPDLLCEYEYQSIGKDQTISNNSNFDNDVVRALLQIVNKKEESAVNAQIETSKKQSVPAKISQTFRPSLILMTGNQKTKESAYAWFKQLANNEPLIKLAKKIPVFNKRADNLPEILITLYEYQVSISRAVWYLKIMVLACTTHLNEANKKKRQTNIDVSSEWSIPLIRLLKEIFYRLQYFELSAHHHHGHHGLPPNMTLESFMNVENLNLILLPVINHSYLTEKKLKCLWSFTTKIMRAMLDQNLLDKQYILESLIDLLEKSTTSLNLSKSQQTFFANNTNDTFLTNRFLLSTISQNMYHFLQSEILCRRLAYFCCKRISNLFNEYSNVFFEKILKQIQQKYVQQKESLMQNAQKTDASNQTDQQALDLYKYIIKNDVPLSSIKSIFDKFTQCPVHRDQLIQLLSIVHAVQLGCMQALIWNKVGDGQTESPYNGSALDFLPCPPSTLLYTYDYLGITKETKEHIKRELEKSELSIKRRSIEIETKWATDKLKVAAIGIVQTKILAILDVLDKHCYDLSDVNETIEILYSQIFRKIDLNGQKPKKLENFLDIDCVLENEQESDEYLEEGEENEANRPLPDKDIINLLCDWATTSKRCGLHRIFYAVFLIKKRQIELIQQVKEFNKMIKKRLKKKLKLKMTKKVEDLGDKKENGRKRKLEEEDDIDLEDGGSEEAPNASKKIKLEPENIDDLKNNLNQCKIISKTQIATKIKKKYSQNIKKSNLEVAKNLRKIQALKKAQKNLKEKLLYEYPFQKILFDYLEQKSEILPQKQDMNYLVNVNSNNLEFTQLISLFHMLINCKIFSHDQFMRDLISRGDNFRNNLSDIKRPINVFMSFKKKQMETKQQQIKAPLKLPISRNSIEYPMSIEQHPPASMPPYNLPPHTPHLAPNSVPTPSNKSFEALKSNSQLSLKSTSSTNGNSQTSKLAVFVLNLPMPHTQTYQHERNQRFVLLYGFGSKKQEILEKIHSLTKHFQKIFSRKYSIDLNETTTITSLKKAPGSSSSNQISQSTNINSTKHFNVITNSHVTLNSSELDNLNQIQFEYSKMSFYDQYSIIWKVNQNILDIYKSLEQKNYLPKLQYILFVFDLMETNMNIFNLFLFVIKLLQMGPNIEAYLKGKFVNAKNSQGSKLPYFEYLSHFYLNVIGVLRLHLISLVLWKDLACEVFKSFFKLVRHVEKPSKCSSHEKCALMLLNEMYTSCSYIKAQFPQFDSIANKIRAEKCFTQTPNLDKSANNQNNYQMRSDELLTSMITTTDHTIDEIENYIVSRNLYYNFVAHVFLSLSSLSKDDMLRVSNLCVELTSRCNVLITFWQNATKALHHRNTEPTKEKAMFNELLNKINIQNPKCKENFKLFLSILASRHCLILNDLIIMVVKTCVMACPGITSDQSHNASILEPSASLACHIIHYIFTSSPKPLKYRRSSTDQRMITASCRSIMFNTFLLVLKCLFLLSEPKKDTSNNRRNQSSSSTRLARDDKNDEQIELDQFASTVLQEICEHDWIKERCFHEGDNLLKTNQLLEPALGRRAQNLLHIICYPQSHELRKQNEQSSTKDFIRNILQNLDIWTLRESLLEFKLMIELEKQKERYYEYAVECLAKTTVDFLIDPEKTTQSSSSNLSRSTSQIDASQDSEKEPDPQFLKSPIISEKNENMLVDETNENISEVILAETDLNLNMDMDHNEEYDEFDNLGKSSTTQTVGVWLIAPLITRLPDTCQLKVLEHASKSLQELGKAFWNAKNKTEKETQAIKNIIAWNQQPFFSLLISCLKNTNNNEQHQQQRILLTSLFNGLTDFINGKEDKILSEDPRIKQIMLDTLHIRLSLVGSMFDFILKNSNDFANWAWLFVQLISSGVIDPDNDQLLLTIIVDMLSVLVHHVIALEPNLESNKHYQNIIKKISKETKDFSDVPNTKAINYIRKIMPLNRSACLDTLVVESYSTTASKTLANLLDKRRGFKFARKEKISTWELIEGVKNASSLCLSWYGYNKLERKMLRYEYQQKLLLRHKHMNIHKELTLFKEKPEVPNDLIDLPEPVIIETVKKEQKPVLNSSVNKPPLSNMNTSSSLQSFLTSDQMKTNINSPALCNVPNADIVVLGSNLPNQMDMMMPQHVNPQIPMQQQHYMQGQQAQMSQQSHPSHPMMSQQMPQMAQNHTQIMNRLQNQMQQHQQMQQFGQTQNIQMPPNQMPVAGERKSLTRQISTPDKQRAGSGSTTKKQKSTTPRKNSNLKNAANPQIPGPMPGVQGVPNAPQVNKMMPTQTNQFIPNQMIPNQGFPPNQQMQMTNRPLNQQQGGMMQPGMVQQPVQNINQRIPPQANQQNFFQNQPPQSLTPQPPTSSNQIPNQAQFAQGGQRIPQQQQQPPPSQGQIPPQSNRMGYPPNQPMTQQPVQPLNQARKPVPMPPNQPKPMPGYQPQMNQPRPMVPQQGQQPANVQQFQNNPQIFNKQQPAMPVQRTGTPEPGMNMVQPNNPMIQKPGQPQAGQNFINQQQGPRPQLPQQQVQQAQQQRMFNTSTPPNPNVGLQLPTSQSGQAQPGQNMNWQQQRQQPIQRPGQMPPQQQIQQPPQFPQQQQQQYLQKQLSGPPIMNNQQMQPGQQQQAFNLQQQQQQQRIGQQQQQQQPPPHQQNQQQYQNY
ncbi:unnamed protein product, partial [Brachionus calyciflorus]